MSTDELTRLRAEMDTINLQLLSVLQQRAELLRRIARHKRAHGLPLVDTARERDMLQALLQRGGDGFDRAALQQILEVVFARSRELVQRAEA